MTTVLALISTACVAGADGPSPTDPHDVTTTTTTADPASPTTVILEQGLTSYRGCLAAEGVTIDEIQLDGLGRPRIALAMSDIDFTDRAVLSALEVCGPELSSGALDLGADPQLRDLVQARLQEFAECVRSYGVPDYPSPAPAFDGVGSPFPPNRIPWADPALPAAVSACEIRP